MFHPPHACSANYYRNFFADKAYDDQAYESGERILPYEDYASGKVTKGKMRSTDKSTNMRVLRRGRSRRVDMFLDWLASLIT